jgi:hypothetical protein
MVSHVDLRKILPTGNQPVIFDDTFELQKSLVSGRYELRMRVIDPKGYLNPMQLALQNEMPEGYYPLGFVVVPDVRPH